VTVASSHREAPFITSRPKVDATDLYLFNSYEPGRSGYVTLIANYQPFENPQGGPNYYTMDPRALYEIHIDNTGSGKEALTFQFRFKTTDAGLTVMAGTKAIPVPLSNIGAISAGSSAQNVAETYTLTLVKGDRRTGNEPAARIDHGHDRLPARGRRLGARRGRRDPEEEQRDGKHAQSSGHGPLQCSR
jgi:hypothetical protein